LSLSLSVEGDDWLVADPLDVSWAAPWEAEDDDAESDDGAGDAGMADFEDEEAELVGGGSDDVLWRSPQAPSSKAALIAIDSVESFIAFPFMTVIGTFMDEHQCDAIRAHCTVTLAALDAAHHRHDTDAPVGRCRRLRLVCNSAWSQMPIRRARTHSGCDSNGLTAQRFCFFAVMA
jgi:hypothetical protein